MPILADVEALLSALTREEKASLLQTIANDLGDSFPGMDKDPAVCGGEACIVRTGIPVWTLVRARQLGLREAEILRSYPTLRAEDLARADLPSLARGRNRPSHQGKRSRLTAPCSRSIPTKSSRGYGRSFASAAARWFLCGKNFAQPAF